MKKVELDPKEDSGEVFENWPNEKMLWVRLGACILVGLAVATGLFIGAVILVNKILEQ